MTHEELLCAFEAVYGPRQGKIRYMNVLPAVLADFSSMLDKAHGGTLREEYRLDDGRGVLILTGSTAGRRIDIDFQVSESAQ